MVVFRSQYDPQNVARALQNGRRLILYNERHSIGQKLLIKKLVGWLLCCRQPDRVVIHQPTRHMHDQVHVPQSWVQQNGDSGSRNITLATTLPTYRENLAFDLTPLSQLFKIRTPLLLLIIPRTVVTLMGYTTFSALAGLVLLILWLRRRSETASATKSHGCEPAVTHYSKDPFLSMDFQVKLFTQIPFPYSLHKRHGHTFQAHGWASKLPTICTMSPQNIRAINSSKDYGVEPTRLPGMEYFCGKGFITTDGDTWSQSRKLLKPSFDYNNIQDLTILQEEVDKLIKQLPKDGATIDFQPLFYVMVSDTHNPRLILLTTSALSFSTRHCTSC